MWRPALIKLTSTATVSSTAGTGSLMTYTTSTAHGFVVGSIVTITGASITGYNVTNSTITAVTSTTFSVSGSATGSATGTILATADHFMTDHNRQPVQESNEKIENAKRMANGLMRKYVIANKKSFSVSWTMIPGLSSQTVDGYLGAIALRDLYINNYGKSMTLSLYAGSISSATRAKGLLPAATNTYTVFINDFNATINKRLGDVDYWDASISFEEA